MTIVTMLVIMITLKIDLCLLHGNTTNSSFSLLFRFIAQKGVRAKYMRSQFPTKTFPNHYSIITVSHSLTMPPPEISS